MAAITRIDLRLLTATLAGAGTDSDVYLGLAGREFFVDSSADDFETGSDRNYVFGSNANVTNAAGNDPRSPLPIDTNELDSFPRYIRMEPKGSDPGWAVELMEVKVNLGQPSQRNFAKLTGTGRRVHLSQTTGKYLYF